MIKNPRILVMPGDGIGPEEMAHIVPVLKKLLQYYPHLQPEWKESQLGNSAEKEFGEALPQQTIDLLHWCDAAIKGPTGTPLGKGRKSVNVGIRRLLKLYAGVRPVYLLPNAPSPVKNPEKVNWVIFRENTQGNYVGIETNIDTTQSFIEALTASSNEYIRDIGFNIREYYENETDAMVVGLDITSKLATKRLMRAAINYAINHKQQIITIVCKNNIKKEVDGRFLDWCYDVAQEEYSLYTWRNALQEAEILVAPEEIDRKAYELWTSKKNLGEIVINEVLADNFEQQGLQSPDKFQVIVMNNMNGDYFSDFGAAMVGGLGVASGANINYETGAAVFEAVGGTAPDIAGKNLANPSAIILCFIQMFQYLSQNFDKDYENFGNTLQKALEQTLLKGIMTGDFARQKENVRAVSMSDFINAVSEEFHNIMKY